jgi:signal transduction histidine kinase
MHDMRLPISVTGAYPGAPVSVVRAVAIFALSGLATLLIFVVSLAYLLAHAGHDEAIQDAQRLTAAYGLAAVHPLLDDGLLTFKPEASARFAAGLREPLANSPIVRMKVWDQSGTILYSDEPRLIGLRFPLDEEAREVMGTGQTLAEVSDTTKAENTYERDGVQLLEVYQRLETPGGTPVLFEAYLPFDSVQAMGREVWLAIAPIVLIGLALMWLLQLPLAWSMARQVKTGQETRERLLQRALDMSDTERKTLAADLHNGVVQTLAGMAFSLGALEQHLPSDTPDETRAQVGEASRAARSAIRELRSMLVNLYPPTLRSAGLESALNDLAAHLQARGIDTIVSVDLPERPPAAAEALLYRSAQEALRNIAKHAAARHARLSLVAEAATWHLTVVDDGTGGLLVDGDHLPAGTGERMGLRLLTDMVNDADGALRVMRGENGGTVFDVELPRRSVALIGA